MLSTPLWLTLQLSGPATAPYPLDGRVPVFAATQPLIGGPPFLELHVCIKHGDTLLDFVPRSPTEASTALRLLSGSGVDGLIRCRPAGADDASEAWRLLGYSRRSSEDMVVFARKRSRELALRTNNCWTFASSVVGYAEAGVEMGGDSSRGT